MPQNIEEQIKAYLLEKLAEITAVVPGHVTVGVIANRYSSGCLEVNFTSYSGHFSEGFSEPTVDKAIAAILAKTGGKTEVELLREQAARLLANAERLEAQIQKPNPSSKAALEAFHNSTKEAA